MTCTLCHREIGPHEPIVDEDGVLCTECVMATWTDAMASGLDAKVVRYVMRHQPFTRADCAGLPTPCPLVSCRFNWANSPPNNQGTNDEKSHPCEPLSGCSLKMIEGVAGRHTLDEIGWALGMTRERVRQVEVIALRKMRATCEAMGFSIADFHAAIGYEYGPGAHEQHRERRREYERRRKAMKESA